MDISQLSAHFPREAIHWRAQTVTRNKDKALALAYLDARDVMDRLDEVCGPENWQSRYTETARGRVLCEIGIRINDDWVWKSDGAGDTAVEGEKGGISDALKRAAVQWGIGRYLYRLPNVWVPCECNDKGQWKRWTDDPWNHARGAPQPKPRQVQDQMADFATAVEDAVRSIGRETDAEGLKAFWTDLCTRQKAVAADAAVVAAKDKRKAELARAAA